MAKDLPRPSFLENAISPFDLLSIVVKAAKHDRAANLGPGPWWQPCVRFRDPRTCLSSSECPRKCATSPPPVPMPDSDRLDRGTSHRAHGLPPTKCRNGWRDRKDDSAAQSQA